MYEICYAHNPAIKLLLTSDHAYRVQVHADNDTIELALRSGGSLLAVTRQVENYASGGTAVPCNPRTVHEQWLTDMPPARRLLGSRRMYHLTSMALRKIRKQGKLRTPRKARLCSVREWPPMPPIRGHTVRPLAPVWGAGCIRCDNSVTYDVSADGFVFVTGVHCRQCDTVLCRQCLQNNGWACACGRRIAAQDREKLTECGQKKTTKGKAL